MSLDVVMPARHSQRVAMTATPFASACELAAMIRSGQISAYQLTEFYLARIHQHNHDLHAIVIGNDVDALRTARERDDDLQNNVVRGPLHGVPVTVKESFNVAGLKTTVNFAQLKDNVASQDAFVVRQLRDAGAALLGKTNIPTMLSDYQSFGPVYPTANNPYDLTRTPGGSTGGGAAAVAAGLTTLEIGSDIVGSIRVPAHFCGVFGLKPTENIPMHGEGHVPPVPDSRGGFVAMVSVGPLARTMSDIELGWRRISQQAWSYGSHLPAKPRVKNALSDYRIAWFDDAGRVECGNETRTTLGALIQSLASAGVHCENRPFDPSWLDQAYSVWGQLYGAMSGQDAPWLVRQLLKFQFARLATGASIDIAAAVKTGLSLDFKGFSRALEQRKELVQELQRRFEDYDFVISPVATGPAFAHNPEHAPIELDGRAIAYLDYAMPFVAIYNACGNPALVIPAGRSGGGLPIGLQIAAPHYAEDELIHFGTLVERLGATFAPPRGYE